MRFQVTHEARWRLALLALGGLGFLSGSRRVAAQAISQRSDSGTTQSSNVPAGVPTDSLRVPLPLVGADFTEPRTPVDWQSAHFLHACRALFEQLVRTNTALVPNASLFAHRKDSSVVPSTTPSSPWLPLPDTAIRAGRDCLRRIGDGHELASLAWPVLLRLAVGVNADSVVQTVVARQLGAADTSARSRAQVLANTITRLLHNQWDEGQGVLLDDTRTHRSAVHDALARAYAAQLDTLQPAAQVVVTRLRVNDELGVLDPSSDSSSTGWDVDRVVAQTRRRLRIAQSVPLSALSAEDRAIVQGAMTSATYTLAEATYFRTPTHANLIKFLATRDSLAGMPQGQTIDSVLARPAGRLDGDYWFNVPAGAPPPVIPAPGAVSLLMFIDAQEGRLSALGSTQEDFAKLQRLHAKYPALQIVLVALTHGQFLDENLRTNPAEEAARIHHLLTDVIKLPGVLCVIETKYHTEEGATSVPLSSPILDRYQLDPLSYDNHQFLIDAEGWVVQDQFVLDGHLIPRLLGKKH